MDRRSLLCGMGLGGAIALGGMLIGGQAPIPPQQQPNPPGGAQPAKPAAPPAPKVERFDKLTVREIEFQNSKGRTVMLLKQQEDLASIEIWDGGGQQLVRIGGILRGGGQIMTFDRNKAIVEITSTGQGGAVRVMSLQNGNGTIMTANNAGPAILGQQGSNIVFQLPPGAQVLGAPPAAQPGGAQPGPAGVGQPFQPPAAPGGAAPNAPGAPGTGEKKDEPKDKPAEPKPGDAKPADPKPGSGPGGGGAPNQE